MSWDSAIGDLRGRLSHAFNDPELLELALSHRSWCAEHENIPSNERLEFLGDAVLGLAIADFVYHGFEDLPEGHLAQMRSAVVNTVALADMARELELGAALRLGKGEAASGGSDKESILADCMEAVIGAVYLDGGWKSARAFVVELCEDRVIVASKGPGGTDYKTRLQEYSAQAFNAAPEYNVASSGPDHAKEFRASVSLAGSEFGAGTGRSKKEAQQSAAEAAWRQINNSERDKKRQST